MDEDFDKTYDFENISMSFLGNVTEVSHDTPAIGVPASSPNSHFHQCSSAMWEAVVRRGGVCWNPAGMAGDLECFASHLQQQRDSGNLPTYLNSSDTDV